jgi:hypothetical protein
MSTPVICFDTPEEREESIKNLVASLRFHVEAAEHGSPDQRSAAMLIELMPVFLRFLDRERMVFITAIKNDKRKDRDASLDEFLQMMTLPLVNMLGASILTVVPTAPGMEVERKQDMRLMLARNVMDNLFSGVVGYFNSAEDQLEKNGVGNGKLHS